MGFLLDMGWDLMGNCWGFRAVSQGAYAVGGGGGGGKWRKDCDASKCNNNALKMLERVRANRWGTVRIDSAHTPQQHKPRLLTSCCCCSNALHSMYLSSSGSTGKPVCFHAPS